MRWIRAIDGGADMRASKDNAGKTLLDVRNLNIAYRGELATVEAVSSLSFDLSPGETLGIVGESGSGKTQTALALMGLLPATASVNGSAVFEAQELLGLPEYRLNALRGNRMAMIFQDPMTALNPHLKVGRQMSRVLEHHQGLSARDAFEAAAGMLDAVRVPDARTRLRQYPHEMSGGMRQRIMIATALLCKPALLLADEPTTALDVTVQAQILAILRELQAELGTAILLITHDMGVVAGNCSRVLVMREGRLRESGSADDVFYRPRDSYTRQLLAAVPRLDAKRSTQLTAMSDADSGATEPLLRVSDLRVAFPADRPRFFARRRQLIAVDGVSLDVRRGETLGIVGESGCGKSTLARAVLQLLDGYSGRVCLLGTELGQLRQHELIAQRQKMQVVFQDPLASLDPRMTVGDIIAEPLQTFEPQMTRAERRASVQRMLARVGLLPEHADRYPHEFSGGQCQRIGIARALIARPELVICDEPVSALDVSVQAQVVNLLIELQQEMGLALVFIAHDLAVVRYISHRVLVLYLGRVAEIADSVSLYESPRHPYTQALIAAVPIPDPQLQRSRQTVLLRGDVPSPLDPPSGCAFRTRCPQADALCAAERPQLRTVGASELACHHA